jgi:hypothetical protein
VVAEVSASDQLEVGQPAQLQLTLRSADGGLPLADAPVTVYTEVSFGGVTGEVELGRAVTDENGIARVAFQPRTASDHQLRIEYLAPGETQPEVVTTTISVTGAAAQLHRSTSGIQVPGLNVWLIMALIALVWIILLSVGLRVVAIARASTDAEPVFERAAYLRGGEPQVAAPEAGGSEA